MAVPADDPLIDLDVARRVGEVSCSSLVVPSILTFIVKLYLRHAEQLANVDKVRSTLAVR